MSLERGRVLEFARLGTPLFDHANMRWKPQAYAAHSKTEKSVELKGVLGMNRWSSLGMGFAAFVSAANSRSSDAKGVQSRPSLGNCPTRVIRSAATRCLRIDETLFRKQIHHSLARIRLFLQSPQP
jgi:hypothetical protein